MYYSHSFKYKIVEESEEIEQDIEVEVDLIYDEDGSFIINSITNTETKEDFMLTEKQLEKINGEAGERFSDAVANNDSYISDLRSER